VNVARDNEQEAEQVVMKLMAHRFEHRGKWGDYAILYRGNHQARVFEQQLRNQKIAYAISGGQSFFDKAEIKDLIAWLRLIANSDDDPAFIRAITTPRRGIGATTLEGLGGYAGVRHASLFAAAFDDAAAGYLNPKPARGPCASSATSSTSWSMARPARAGAPGAGGFPARHRLRGLAVRQLRSARGRDQVGQRARFRRLAGEARARKRTRPCSN
jgi:hypothetical protein